jgi:hypothetical protein
MESIRPLALPELAEDVPPDQGDQHDHQELDQDIFKAHRTANDDRLPRICRVHEHLDPVPETMGALDNVRPMTYSYFSSALLGRDSMASTVAAAGTQEDEAMLI